MEGARLNAPYARPSPSISNAVPEGDRESAPPQVALAGGLASVLGADRQILSTKNTNANVVAASVSPQRQTSKRSPAARYVVRQPMTAVPVELAFAWFAAARASDRFVPVSVSSPAQVSRLQTLQIGPSIADFKYCLGVAEIGRNPLPSDWSESLSSQGLALSASAVITGLARVQAIGYSVGDKSCCQRNAPFFRPLEVNRGGIPFHRSGLKQVQ